MLLTQLSRTLFAALAAAPLLAVADPSPDPAPLTYDGCRPTQAFIARTRNMRNTYAGGVKNKLVWWTDKSIQMAECHSNPRVMHNVFSAFTIDPNKFTAEGGPYGDCTAWAVMPEPHELEQDPDNQSSCGFWNRGDPLPSSIPGQLFINMPIISPHNLPKCYAKDYYQPGGKLAELGKLVSNYTGRVTGPKDKNHKQLYCECLDCGCEPPTWYEFVTHTFKCDTSQCIPWAVKQGGSFAKGTVSTYTNDFNNGRVKGTEAGIGSHIVFGSSIGSDSNKYLGDKVSNPNQQVKAQHHTGQTTSGRSSDSSAGFQQSKQQTQEEKQNLQNPQKHTVQPVPVKQQTKQPTLKPLAKPLRQPVNAEKGGVILKDTEGKPKDASQVKSSSKLTGDKLSQYTRSKDQLSKTALLHDKPVKDKSSGGQVKSVKPKEKKNDDDDEHEHEHEKHKSAKQKRHLRNMRRSF